MLSRIEAIQPMVQFVLPIQPPDPWKADNIDPQELSLHQTIEFDDEITEVKQGTDEFRCCIKDGLLCTFVPPHKGSLLYMRLLLPQAYRQQVIDPCHTEANHATTAKTLARIQDNYVWPEMRKTCERISVHLHPLQDINTVRSCSTQGKGTNATSALPHLGHRPGQTLPSRLA